MERINYVKRSAKVHPAAHPLKAATHLSTVNIFAKNFGLLTKNGKINPAVTPMKEFYIDSLVFLRKCPL